MQELIFWLIIAFIIFGYLFGEILDYLNVKYSQKGIPDLLSGIYDDEKYKKQQLYLKKNHKFSSLQSSLSTILILIVLFASILPLIDDFLRAYIHSDLWLSVIYFGVLFLATSLFSIPFQIYDTFIIEKKFGFNKTTPKTFVLDLIKSFFISIIIGGGLLSFIVYIFNLTQEYFWLLAWGLILGFSIIMNFLYSDVIVPLFNKQKPLEEGELRDAINALAEKLGFKLSKILVLDGSKRSTKANAYFAGFGSRKRIVLYDTLIAEMTVNEIVAVLAHEIGHYKKRHIITGIFLSTITTGVTFYLMSLLLKYPVFTQALYFEQHSFHAGILIFGMLYTPISAIMGIAANLISRKHEYEADAYAGEHYEADALISALKKLSSHNLSNLTPHPFYVFVNYSHPTLLQRILKLNKYRAKNK